MSGFQGGQEEDKKDDGDVKDEGEECSQEEEVGGMRKLCSVGNISSGVYRASSECGDKTLTNTTPPRPIHEPMTEIQNSVKPLPLW